LRQLKKMDEKFSGHLKKMFSSMDLD